MLMPRKEELADGVTLHMGDCREILPTLVHADAVLTDPPYGIGKAEWDGEFLLDWFDPAAALTRTIAVMPGTWNLLRLPYERAGLRYKWTLSAHLINGMTRGRFGWGNWIPLVVYKKPRPPSPSTPEAQEWCGRFAHWLDERQIKTKTLNEILGTASMAGRFRERTWSVIPSPSQWAKIKAALHTPDDLEPCWAEREGLGNDYKPVSDCRAFTIGKEPKPDHPSPKPLAVMRWFLEVIGAENYLDPFMGSGTTGVAAVEAGRRFVGIERNPAHFDVACRRISDALARPSLFVEPRARTAEPIELALNATGSK